MKNDKPFGPGPVFTPTSVERVEQIDTAAEFEKQRRDADEALCSDALVYLKAGLGPVAVMEVVRLRRGADFGVTKEKIQQAVSLAVEFLKKQEKKIMKQANGIDTRDTGLIAPRGNDGNVEPIADIIRKKSKRPSEMHALVR